MKQREEEGAPPEWDGQTQYSDQDESVYAYEHCCLICSRTSPSEWITHEYARRLGLAGLDPCSNCGGMVYMDPVTVGALHSPLQTVPVQAKLHNGTTVPHGRVV